MPMLVYSVNNVKVHDDVIVGLVLLLQSRAGSHAHSLPPIWPTLPPISSSASHPTPSHLHRSHLPQLFYVLFPWFLILMQTSQSLFFSHVALNLASVHSFSLFCQPPSSFFFYHPLLIPCVVQRQGKLVHIAFALPYLSSHTWLHVDLTSNSEDPEQLSLRNVWWLFRAALYPAVHRA